MIVSTLDPRSNQTLRRAVYPGSFDPLTLGHLNVIERASSLFDHLTIAIGENTSKAALFTGQERSNMIVEQLQLLNSERSLKGQASIAFEVCCFSGLLVNFLKEKECQVVIRGIRALSDFEYEYQMAATNRRIYPELETLFLMAVEEQQFTASRFVKEVARHGGDISSFVSPFIEKKLKEKILLKDNA